MKYLSVSLVIVVFILGLVRCSGPRVIAFTGNNPDFGSYYTYRIHHPASPDDQDEVANQMIGKIEMAIEDQMQTRGYELTLVSDIVIAYNLILDNKVDYRDNTYSRYDYSNRYYNYPYGSYPYGLDRKEYTEGTLLVELREELGNKLVWQASLDMKYNKRSSSKKKADPVENAFDIIFSEYPYIAGNSQAQIIENQ